MYCELHCHTHYSLLDGASAPEALLERAAALDMPALAVTDHDGLYGAVVFWQAARKLGIQPIIGAEITLAHGSHLTLLAEDRQGYANLSRLISIGWLGRQALSPGGLPVDQAMAATCLEDLENSPDRLLVFGERLVDRRKGEAEGRATSLLTIDDLARHAGGLICLSGCRQGAIARALLAGDLKAALRGAEKLASIFGREYFWIELQRHWLFDDDRLSAGLLDLASRLGAGIVATNDVHYATPDGYRLHDILTATRHNVPLVALGTRKRLNNEFYLKGEAEMAALFPDHPEALRNTLAIAERCHVSLDFAGQDSSSSDRRLPSFPARSPDFPQGIPPGETEFSVLYRLCYEGLRVRYRPVTPAAMRQLAHELSVIEAAGLAGYFLIVWDIVRFAREQGIRCQGRGSAANSLVAYLLGITPVDPLAHNLLFERFLSERSDTMPDIDVDFAADRRDEVMAYVYRLYGTDHAAMVCNVVTYRWRSAIRDVMRAFQLAGQPPPPQPAGEVAEPPSELAALAAQLVGTPRHISVHVGGMLITARPLVDVVPLQPAAKPGIVVAQWNKDSVEDAGLIKIDLLALRTLGMVSESLALIAGRDGQAPDIDNLPLDDPDVFRLLAEADTIGCFQVESRAQSQMLPRLLPTTFADLIIQVSIVRPGPIQGGMVHPYLRRRAGLEPVAYAHPLLEPVLKETLGVIIFQEQVIRVAVALAGFTPGEADRLRRAMSRSRSVEAMAELQSRFVAGALGNGVEQATAEEVFRQLQGFATYGFCKSHAAAFALVAYQTLWLKAHYPAEFFCALLNQQPMGFYSPDVVVNDARRHGIHILRPHINASQDACTLISTSDCPPAAPISHKLTESSVYQGLNSPQIPGAGSPGLKEQSPYGLKGANPAGFSRLGSLSPAVHGRGDARRQALDTAANFLTYEAWAAPHPSAPVPQLRLGLRYLAGLGQAGRERLLEARGERPFADLADFCRRTRLPRPLVGDLIRAGALDGLPVRPGERGGAPSEGAADRRPMLWTLGGLRYQEEALVTEPEEPVELPKLEAREALVWDYELLGLSPDNHPLRLLRSRLQAAGVLSAASLAAQPSGKIARVAGLVVVRQRPPTAKGHLFITLEDETGLANLVIRPDLFGRERETLDNASLLLAEGIVQREGRATSMLVRRVETLAEEGAGE